MSHTTSIREFPVEINGRLASRLAALHPAVNVVRADAADLAANLAQRGLGHADVMVSGPT